MVKRLAAGDVRSPAEMTPPGLMPGAGEWIPPVVRTIASGGKGQEKLMATVERFVAVGERSRPASREQTAGGFEQMAGGLRIDHLGVAVRSIAAAKGFYEMLGLRVDHEETVEHEQVKTAMLPLGESRIELLEPTAADSTIGRYLDKRGEGLHHVALQVSGIDAKFAEMQAAGVRLASDQVRVGAGGHRYFFVHPASTGGVLVELVEAAG